MAEISLNPLSGKQRKLLQFGVVILLMVFLGAYFLIPKQKPEEKVRNNSVYIEKSILHVFDDSYSLEQYPDRVLVHYPYVIMVKPTQSQSIAYNVLTKDKKDFNETIVDYDGENKLTNQGKISWFNQIDLGLLCDIGFIKSNSEVLCVTRIFPNDSNNKLISIDPNTKKQKDIYSSQNLVTAISVINEELYIGSIYQFNNKSYIRINDKEAEFPDVVSFIYQMNGKPYVVSLKSAFNNQTENYYEINNLNIKKQIGKITIYKDNGK